MVDYSGIVISIISSAAIFTFIQFLISRHDLKSDKLASILLELQDMRKDISELHLEVDKIEAQNARIRILDASDQIRRKVKHSEEYFNQINDDVTAYKRYCDKHPEFVNNKAKHAIENIDRAYQHAIQSNDFL